MVRRTVLVGLLVAGLVVGLVVGIPAGSSGRPAAAQTAEYIELSGDFSSDPGDEWLSYTPGPEPDWITVLGNGGVPGGTLTTTTSRDSCIGTMTGRPVVGNFDGTGYDEIFIYGPGSGGDAMVRRGGGFCTQDPRYTVGGDYQPIAGDFTGDGVDDIYWYTPGVAADPLWDFNPGGGYTSVNINNNSTYRPVVASIGKDATDDIVWYSPPASCDTPATAPTLLWDFTQGTTTYTTETLSIEGGPYEPFAFDQHGQGWRGHDLFWYSPTGTASPVWDYAQGVRSERVEPLSGDYQPVAGDFFGDGQDDIVWSTATQFVVWDHNGTDRWEYDRARQW
jgi:hypothetical protein